MKDHVYNTFLDFGVLGELEAEVFYDYYAGTKFNDPYLPPEPAYADVTAVCVWIDGKEVDVKERLSADLPEDLAYECGEDYRG